MRLFRREEITVRCAFRGAGITAPNAKRTIDACAQEHQEQLRRRLNKAEIEAHGWLVEWRKQPGEAVRSGDIIAALRCPGIVVELATGQKGVIVEALVADGEQAFPRKRMARLAKALPAPTAASSAEKPHEIGDLLRHYVARQRSDAETIKRLEGDLAEYRRMADRLSSEVYQLRAGLLPAGAASADPKFRRLKHEFSKRFHPDARPAADPERAFRELVFREFWPILEEIERS